MRHVLIAVILLVGLVLLWLRREPGVEVGDVDVIPPLAAEGALAESPLLEGADARDADADGTAADDTDRGADATPGASPTRVDAASSVMAGSDYPALLEPVYVREDPGSLLSIVAIDVTQTAAGDSQSQYFWRLELKNDAAAPARPDLVLEYLDAQGEVVDDDQLADLSLGAQSTQVFEGTSVVRGGTPVARLRVRQR